jgi:hypothetical protein
LGKLREIFIRITAGEWMAAGVACVVLWVVTDLLSVGDSKILGLIRVAKNKASEYSIGQLEKRIKELEKYRDSLNRMIASDKLLYLTTFRHLFGTLIFICIGLLLLTLRHSVMLEAAAAVDPRGANGFFALDMGTIFIFTIAIVVAISGVDTALLDTRTKLEEQIAKYDKNIADLKEILRQRLEKLGRG